MHGRVPFVPRSSTLRPRWRALPRPRHHAMRVTHRSSPLPGCRRRGGCRGRRSVTATGSIGAVPGTLDMGTADILSLIGPFFDLGLDTEGDFKSERGDAVQDDLAEGLVDPRARHAETACYAGAYACRHALVIGDFGVVAAVIADGHAPPSAHRWQALEQGQGLLEPGRRPARGCELGRCQAVGPG
jgi:hypothetical protein